MKNPFVREKKTFCSPVSGAKESRVGSSREIKAESLSDLSGREKGPEGSSSRWEVPTDYE